MAWEKYQIDPSRPFNFMAAVTIHSDFGAQEKKICHCFHFSAFYLPWSDGSRCYDLRFLKVEFYACFSLSFHLYQEALEFVFTFCHKSGIICTSELLIFLPAVLIPACDSSSLGFCMMYSAYKLNKHSDNIQPWQISFKIWNQSIVPFPVLTAASWPAYRFLRRQVRWSGISICWKIFHSLLWSTQPKVLA